MRGARDGNGKQSRKKRSGADSRLTQLLGVGLVGTGLVGSSVALAGIEFKSFQTHSHVAVAVDPTVIHNVEKIEKDGKLVGLRLVLDNVREDLEDLASSVDSRTEHVKVTRSTTVGGKKVIYEFLLSERAKAAGIEYFDYRNKVPSEISLDYWLKSQKIEPGAATALVKPTAAPVVHRKPARAKAEKPIKQDPALAGCGQPLNFAVDGGASWKVYHKPFEYRAFFNLMPADSGYAYPELAPKAKKDEEKRREELAHYRLAFKLYKETKYALVLRTIEFFDAQYAASPLRAELDFLRASTLVQLSRLLRTERYMDQALEIHRRIVLEAPDTERGKRSLAFVVQQLMDRGTPIFALEFALVGAEQKYADPNDLTKFTYRLAAAEALFALGEYDRAERSYQNVVDQGNKLSPEAAFRMGEIFSVRKLWERAALVYEKAIHDFPKEADRFPTAWFNLAEAYFRLDRFADSERVYREFGKRFPADGALWASELRLAELEQMKIKTPDGKKNDIIKDLYEQVVNRHPYTPGAVMAELRLSRCHRGLKASDPTRQFFGTLFSKRELKRLESPLVDALEAEVWVDYTDARFNADNGDARAALKRADEYRHRLAKLELGESFRKIFSESIVALVKELSDAKEILAAVEHYGDFSPKPEPVGYVLAIAKARQSQGDYKGAAEGLAAIEGRLSEASDLEKDWFRLSRARQARLLGEKLDRAMLDLSQIRDDGELGAVKYDELAQCAYDKADFKASIAYDNRLLETQLGNKLTIQRRFEVTVRRLESLNKTGIPSDVAKQADYALLKFGAQTQFPELIMRVRDIRARALYDSGNFKGAVESIDEILSAQPNHPRRTEFEFMRGKGLTKLGRDGEALEAFRKLAQAAKDDVWKKSAQAELDQIQWENNVQNQIKGTGGL